MLALSFLCSRAESVRRCVETELLKCPDPTPANVVNSMQLAMRAATPCGRDDPHTVVTSRMSSSSAKNVASFLALAASSALLRH